MPESIRGKNLPPAPLPVVVNPKGIQLIGEATRQALSPVQQVGHAVLERMEWEMNQGHPGHQQYEVEGTADLPLARVVVKTTVKIYPRFKPGD